MKKLLLFLIIGIFMISLVSASIDKNFIKDETTNKYGKVEISDCGFLGSGCLLGFGTKLADLELKKNTDTCGFDCSAETEIILYKDGALIDNVKFLEKQNDGNWIEKSIKSYYFYIKTGEDWKLYNLGDKLNAGTYYIKLEGTRNSPKWIDWQITSQGKLIDEWAVWGDYVSSFSVQAGTDLGVSVNGSNIAVAIRGVGVYIYDMEGNSIKNWAMTSFVGDSIDIANNLSNWFISSSNGNAYKYNINGNYLGVIPNIGGGGIVTNNTNFWKTNSSSIVGYNMAGTQIHNYLSANSLAIAMNSKNLFVLNTSLSVNVYNFDGTPTGRHFHLDPTNTEVYGIDLYGGFFYTIDNTLDKVFVYSDEVTNGIAPIIQIINPTPIINYGTSPQTLSWNITDTDLYSVWYNYNGINKSLTGYEALGSTTFTLASPPYNLTLYANDSEGNVNSSYVSWSYNLFENSQTYNSPAYEFSSELFKINISYDNSFYTSISANLVYDGVSYEGARQNIGSNTIISRTIGLPSVSIVTNKTFYWNISLTNLSTTTSFISNYYNQTVYPINFIFCNATYPTISLNFSLFDELTNLLISNSLISNFQSTFKYWIGGGINYKTYSFQNLTGGNNYQFCLSPNTTMYLDLDLQYKTNTYSEQTWYLRNFSISNQSQNINLYNLFLNESTKFNINIKQRTDYFTDATVDIYKYFTGEGIYKKVMVGLTDDKGSFVANLDLDQKYNFTIIKGGINYGSYEKTASCLTSPCEIDINVGDITLSGYVDLANYFAQYVIYNLSYNKNLSRVNLTFQDTLGTAQYWRLWVYRVNYGNDSIITICDEKSYSVSGTLSCDYTGYLGDLTAKVYVSRSPEKLVDFINFVNENATSILGTSAILASIIIILVVFFAGTRNPTVALILIPFALVLLKFIGFIPIGWGWIGALTIFCIWLANKMNT